MTRRFLTFDCESSRLHATLDGGAGMSGLLFVTGGNEIRAGVWDGHAQLAARIAARGFPVFRFDRRGVGDSEGPNLGFRHSAPDIRAAIAQFRAEQPQLTRVVAMGNCDAASALALAGGAGADALVLSNPWTLDHDESETTQPVQALRAHYRQRLTNRPALMRMVTGKVPLKTLFGSLRGLARPSPARSSLALEMNACLDRFCGEVAILLAERDRTAQAFLGEWDKQDSRLKTCPGASHSFVESAARDWLEEQVLEVLAG